MTLLCSAVKDDKYIKWKILCQRDCCHPEIKLHHLPRK